MKSNAKNQIMANAPSLVKKSHFDNLYHSITAEAETCALESDNRKKQAELQKRELELKEQSDKLRESLERAATDDEVSSADDEEVECVTSPCAYSHDTNLNQSK